MGFLKRSVGVTNATPLGDAPRPDWSKQARQVEINRCPHCKVNLDALRPDEEHVCKKR